MRLSPGQLVAADGDADGSYTWALRVPRAAAPWVGGGVRTYKLAGLVACAPRVGTAMSVLTAAMVAGSSGGDADGGGGKLVLAWWGWILVGAAGLVAFAPIAVCARRLLPPRVCAHSAMVLAQLIFGAGTVLVGGDMQAHPIDPVVFALVREAMAALALGTAAAVLERTVQFIMRFFSLN